MEEMSLCSIGVMSSLFRNLVTLLKVQSLFGFRRLLERYLLVAPYMIYSLLLTEGIWGTTRELGDIVSETSAIGEVQDSEKRAAESVLLAEEGKKGKVAAAHEKARKIIEEAEAESRSAKEAAERRGAEEAARETKRVMADAEKAAAKIRKAKPTAAALKGIADEIVKGIAGE